MEADVTITQECVSVQQENKKQSRFCRQKTLKARLDVDTELNFLVDSPFKKENGKDNRENSHKSESDSSIPNCNLDAEGNSSSDTPNTCDGHDLIEDKVRIRDITMDLEHSNGIETTECIKKQADPVSLVQEREDLVADNLCELACGTNVKSDMFDEFESCVVESKYLKSDMGQLITSCHGNGINTNSKNEIWRPSRKRKQTRPRSRSGELSDGDDDCFVDKKMLEMTDDEMDELTETYHEADSVINDEITQKPLFSILNVTKKRRQCRRKDDRIGTLSRDDIIDIINNSTQQANIPRNTNRYRRHFFKHQRKEEVKQKQMIEINLDLGDIDGEECDSIPFVCNPNEKDLTEDILVEDNSTILEDGMGHNDGMLECKICLKNFTDVDTLSAHYVSHGDFERENNLNTPRCVSVSERSDSKEISDNINEDLDDSDSESLASSCVDSEQSGTKEKQGSSILESSTYFCHVCHQRFTNITALQNHVAEHSTEGEGTSDAKGEKFCSICQKRFASAGSLHVHNKIHTGDNPYTCNTCSKSFRDKTRLTTHIRVHTGEKPFVCSVCQKSFSQKGNLKLHQKIHTGERNCVCQVCGNAFRSRSDLVRHMKVHGFAVSSGSENEESNQKVAASSPVKSGFTFRHQSANPDNTHHQQSNKIKDLLEANDNVTPIITLQGVKGIDSLHHIGMPETRQQLSSHDMPDNYKIGHDNDGFKQDRMRMRTKFSDFEASTYMMNLNMEVEFIKAMTDAKLRSETATVKSYACPLCGLKLGSFDAFNHHVLLQHNPLTAFGPPSVPSFESSERSSPSERLRSLASSWSNLGSPEQLRSSLGSSERSRTNQRSPDGSRSNYRSSERSQPSSGSSERPRSNLASPEKLKSPLSPSKPTNSFLALFDPFMLLPKTDKYSCKECNEVFSCHDDLTAHLTTHRALTFDPKGSRLSSDSRVGSFSSPTDMIGEMKYTSCEKLYSCDFCTKTFRRSHHLQTHLRTHTGDRPYTCLECNKCFARCDHLQNHRRTHTGEKPYQCDVCFKSYSQSHHLLRHKRTHTGERPYECSLCERTFSRDHHLKKHMETHRMMEILPEQQECNTDQGIHQMLRYPVNPFNMMSAGSSHRIGQLMVDMTTENSASKLMESMIKQHLKEEERKQTEPNTLMNLYTGRFEMGSDKEMLKLHSKPSTDESIFSQRAESICKQEMFKLRSKPEEDVIFLTRRNESNSEKEVLKRLPKPNAIENVFTGKSESNHERQTFKKQSVLNTDRRFHTSNDTQEMRSVVGSFETLCKNDERATKETKNTPQSLKITDILNEEIDKRMTSHISADLILDHVMRLSRPRSQTRSTPDTGHLQSATLTQTTGHLPSTNCPQSTRSETPSSVLKSEIRNNMVDQRSNLYVQAREIGQPRQKNKDPPSGRNDEFDTNKLECVTRHNYTGVHGERPLTDLNVHENVVAQNQLQKESGRGSNTGSLELNKSETIKGNTDCHGNDHLRLLPVAKEIDKLTKGPAEGMKMKVNTADWKLNIVDSHMTKSREPLNQFNENQLTNKGNQMIRGPVDTVKNMVAIGDLEQNNFDKIVTKGNLQRDEQIDQRNMFIKNLEDRIFMKISEHNMNMSEHNMNTSEHNMNMPEHKINMFEHNINVSEHNINMTENNLNRLKHGKNTSEHNEKMSDWNVNRFEHSKNVHEHNVSISKHNMNRHEHDKSISEHNSDIPEHFVNRFEHNVNQIEHSKKVSEHNVKIFEHDVNRTEHDVNRLEHKVKMSEYTTETRDVVDMLEPKTLEDIVNKSLLDEYDL